MTMIQPQSLKYFAEVARTGSLRQASEVLFVAPSAISKQISNLEKELGATLFDRTPRGAVLTSAGEILLAYVHANTLEFERLQAAIDDLSGLRRGVVRLALVEAAVQSFIPNLVSEFSLSHPGIKISLDVCGTAEIVDAVVHHRADIGLAFNVLNRDDVTLRGRSGQPLQMICRPEHPLAGKKSVSIVDAVGFQIALPIRTFGIRYLVEKAAERAQIELHPVVEANSLQAIKSLVRRSDVVSFMPPLTFSEEATAGWLRGIPLLELDSEATTIDVITSRGQLLSAAAHGFLSVLLDRLRTL